MENNDFAKSEKLAISVDELATTLSIGRNRAHDLIHTRGFPKLKIGRRYIIPAEPLKEWLKVQAECGGAIL